MGSKAKNYKQFNFWRILMTDSTATVLHFASNNNNLINSNDANRYLQTLFERCSQGYIEIRPIPIGQNRQWIPVDKIQVPVLPINKDIYVGVATRQNGKGTKGDIIEIPAVWVDIDFKDVDVETLQRQIDSLNLEPSIAVESGNGYHLYWILDTPAKICDISRIEDVNRRLASYLGGDNKASDAAHILRLPGTYNQKYTPPEPVTLSQIYPDIVYKLSDFNMLPSLPPSSSPAVIPQGNHSGLDNDLLYGVPQGRRNDTAFRLAARYNRQGIREGDAQAWLASWNQKNQPPLDETELSRAIKSAYKGNGQREFALKEPLAEIVNYDNIFEEALMALPDFIRKAYPQREYIIDPLIRPGEIGLISAGRGIGKTWFALSIAMATTMQFPLVKWKKGKATGCLYIDGEMPGDYLQTRVRDLLTGGYTKEAEFIILSVDNMRSRGLPAPRLTNRGWRNAILNYLKSHEEIGLLIIDNLASLTPGLDENIKRDWDDINQWLLDLRAMGKAIIMIHHTGKAGFQRGTSSREDILDFSIILKRPEGYSQDKGAKFTVEFTKGRSIYGEGAKPFTLELRKTDHGLRWIEAEEKESKKETILSMVKAGIKQKQIAEALGISASYVSQIVKEYKHSTGKEDEDRDHLPKVQDLADREPE